MTEQDTSAPSARLAAALAAVQAELPAIAKNRTAEVKNQQGVILYSYGYADLADVSAAILPVLGKHGLAFTAFPGHQPDGKFGLRYFLLHSSGDFLDGFMQIDDKGGSQLVGGRLTYARRYTLCAVTGVAAEDDVDARGDGQERRTRPKSGDGAQQPQRTAQRAKRSQNASPAQDDPPSSAPAWVPAHPQGAGEALPPLPGEDETPLSAAQDAAPGEADSPGSERHRKLIGAVQGQFKRLGYTDDDRDKRLEDAATLAEISGITSLGDMTPDELSVVADTLSRQRNRGALDALLGKKRGERHE